MDKVPASSSVSERRCQKTSNIGYSQAEEHDQDKVPYFEGGILGRHLEWLGRQISKNKILFVILAASYIQ
jgi:hypothetical protein